MPAGSKAPRNFSISGSLGRELDYLLLHFLTARSRNSGEYLVVVFITPSSQELESPGIPGRFKVNYPVALGEEQTKALFDKGETLPVTIVIDKKGIVREVIQGIIYPEEFEQKVKPLLR